jgi:hypothetical protein
MQLKESSDGSLIFVNGIHVPAKYVWYGGESRVLRLTIPDDTTLNPISMPLDMLFEDENIIVINKSDSLMIHVGNGTSGRILVEGILSHCRLSGSGNRLRRMFSIHWIKTWVEQQFSLRSVRRASDWWKCVRYLSWNKHITRFFWNIYQKLCRDQDASSKGQIRPYKNDGLSKRQTGHYEEGQIAIFWAAIHIFAKKYFNRTKAPSSGTHGKQAPSQTWRPNRGRQEKFYDISDPITGDVICFATCF